MSDRIAEEQPVTNGRTDQPGRAGRGEWRTPTLRRLAATDAENGPNANQFDGIEGHS